MKRAATLAFVLAAALVATAVVIALLLDAPDGSSEKGSGARGADQGFGSRDRPAVPGPRRRFGPNRALRRRQQKNLNEMAKELASELDLPEQRVKRALIAVRRRRFEARLEGRIEKIRRSERRAQRMPERGR